VDRAIPLVAQAIPLAAQVIPLNQATPLGDQATRLGDQATRLGDQATRLEDLAVDPQVTQGASRTAVHSPPCVATNPRQAIVGVMENAKVRAIAAPISRSTAVIRA